MEVSVDMSMIENLTIQELQEIDGGVAFTTIALLSCCFAAGLATGLLIS